MRLFEKGVIRRWIAGICCAGIVCGCCTCWAAEGKEGGEVELAVFDLTTDGVENPQAVDYDAPVFAWKLQADERGVMQTAYRIQVTDKRTGKMVWDSGRVENSDAAGVIYGGEDLVSDTPYSWRVKVWDNRGKESDYSPAGFFRAGLFPADWTADYIWDGDQNPNDFAYFRKGFTVRKPVAEAVVYTSAHNDYQLWLNGKFLGAGPARSDPYSYGQYCAYDVTDRLTEGENVFAALAHWHGVWVDSGTNAAPGYILEARIRYTDGSVQVVGTDSSWKTAGTPYIEEDPVYFGFYGGERNRASLRYDARREAEGFAEAGFNDRAWKAAQTVDRSDFRLYAQMVGAQSEMERVAPVSVTRTDNGWLADFGKCLTGWPELRLHDNKSGDEVRAQYWEVEKGWGDAGYDTYICKGGEELFYLPYVRHTSFRLLEITGYEGELTAEDVRGIVAYSFADVQGEFSCSDDRLNAIYEMSERSGRQNIQQGIISVDANREQSPWTADSWNIGVGYLYNHSRTQVVAKVVRDYAGEQRASGNFPTCAPARDYPSEMAEWSMYWPMLLWEQYLFSGDMGLLSETYGNLTKFMTYISRYKSPGTGLYNPPGWRQSDYAGGSLASGGENIATNCQFYENLRIAAEVAALMGRADQAAAYREAGEELKQSINRNLLTEGQSYASAPGSGQNHPLGTAWALRFDLVPAAFKQRVVDWMARQKGAYDVGGYGGDALYNGLYSAGLGEAATADFARYDQMLAANRTNWESFGSLSVDNMGNHAWTAYPSYLLQKYVGGIAPTAGGFAAFDVRPVTGGLDFAQAKVPTVKGNVAVRWEKEGDGALALSVEVPANTTARIYVPDHDLDDPMVTEGNYTVFADGSYWEGCPGLTDGERVDGYVVFTAGSGSYNFRITGEPLYTPEPGSDPQTDFILDDGDAAFGGPWFYDTVSNPEQRYGDSFRYIGGAEEMANASAAYTARIEKAGTYKIYAWWASDANRASNAPYTVIHGADSETVRVNQKEKGGGWNLLTTLSAKAGEEVTVKLTNDADAYVIADGVRIVLDDGVVIDDNEASFDGPWVREAASNPDDRYGDGFRYIGWTDGEPTASAVYETTAEADGLYYVYGWWGVHTNRATNTPYTIACGTHSETVRVNQEVNGGKWNLLGSVEAKAGEAISVTIQNNADEFVIADAVKITPRAMEGNEMNPFQRLQMLVYEMQRADLDTCADPAAAADFAAALEAAEMVCAKENPAGDEVTAADARLRETYGLALSRLRENLALDCGVEASESMEAGGLWGRVYLTDGYKSRDNGNRIGYTSEAYKKKEPDSPIVITIDLGEIQSINEVVLYPRLSALSFEGKTANFPESFSIQTSVDGESFATAKRVEGQPDPEFKPVTCIFERTQARYVRLEATRLGAYAGDENQADNPTPYRLQLSEIEVYGDRSYHSVEVDYNPAGGLVEGETADLPENSEAALTALPNKGWRFTGWYIGGELVCEEAAFTFTVTADLRLTARFEKRTDRAALLEALELARIERDKPDFPEVIESVSRPFRQALKEAEACSADEAAEQLDIDAAAAELSKWTSRLPFSHIGDLNADGRVMIDDVMEACKVLARRSAGKEPSREEAERADLDGAGGVTIADVMEICKILARKA